MKKSVNGKSFDEVFGQRGKSVSFAKLKINVVYFCEESDADYACIFIGNSLLLTEEGILYTSRYDDSIFEKDGLFIATPDQITLLNAYKNE